MRVIRRIFFQFSFFCGLYSECGLYESAGYLPEITVIKSDCPSVCQFVCAFVLSFVRPFKKKDFFKKGMPFKLHLFGGVCHILLPNSCSFGNNSSSN